MAPIKFRQGTPCAQRGQAHCIEDVSFERAIEYNNVNYLVHKHKLVKLSYSLHMIKFSANRDWLNELLALVALRGSFIS